LMRGAPSRDDDGRGGKQVAGRFRRQSRDRSAERAKIGDADQPGPTWSNHCSCGRRISF
jgi:hypothetical protein